MSTTNEFMLKINYNDYPMLKSLKKKDSEKLIIDIFNAGYKLYFPNKDQLIKNQEFDEIRNSIDALRAGIADSDIGDIGNTLLSKINEKIEPLNNSLNKLLGLQTASCKKGELGENIIQNAFLTRYGDILYEDKSGVAHSGDAWIYLPDKEKIMIESKNYTKTINKDEVEKMEYDMKFNNIKFCLFLSLNAPIQGFREMDLHSFSHNDENYFAIMISNLSNDITKLDLGYTMIRKLMELFNNSEKFPWIQKKIKDNLNKVNEIVIKNYVLRDSFYTMEKSIQSSMDIYHKQIRDYQYEMEQLIKSFTNDISTTMVDSIKDKKEQSTKEILLIHKTKKIYQVVSHISDLIEKKKWNLLEISKNKYELSNKGSKIGTFDIALNKATINFPNNQLDLIFNAGNTKQNSQNLKILETNF
jgi:hypothetical protein